MERKQTKREREAIKLVNFIARMQTETEFGTDSPPSEDWIGTLNDLIERAREVQDME